jgi:hypothetical protein
MMKLEQLQHEIEALQESDFLELRKWFADKDWERWDKQLESDIEAGGLEFLIAEARAASSDGTLTDM